MPTHQREYAVSVRYTRRAGPNIANALVAIITFWAAVSIPRVCEALKKDEKSVEKKSTKHCEIDTFPFVVRRAFPTSSESRNGS
jgi:hypothetical protein